jgi:tetratricopeptide (TPR) repeat protein
MLLPFLTMRSLKETVSLPRRQLIGALGICLIFGVPNLTRAETFTKRFEKLVNATPAAEMVDAFVKEWTIHEPDNPEAYIRPANYYFSSRGILISPLPEGKYDVELPKSGVKNEMAIVDPQTGKQVGSIGPNNPRDDENVQKAIDLLDRATTRFPRRMDIWCGLAFMMQETGHFDQQTDLLKRMIVTANKTPHELLWCNGEPIKDSAGRFVPEKLHAYASYYCRKATPEDDERFLKIAQLSAEQYPHHPYAFNDLALYYSIKKMLPETRQYLDQALQADPSDTLVLMNLADTALKMNDKRKARECYQKVIRLNSNPERTQEAKEGLEQLDATTGL